MIEPFAIWNTTDITKTDARTMSFSDVQHFQQLMAPTPPPEPPLVVTNNGNIDLPSEPEFYGPPAPLLHDLNSGDVPGYYPSDWTVMNANLAEWPDQSEVGAVAPHFEVSEWRWVPDCQEGDLCEYLGWGPVTVVSGRWERTHSAEQAVHFRTVADGNGGAEFEAWEVHNLTIREVQHMSGLFPGIDGPPGAPSLAVFPGTDSPDSFRLGFTTDFDPVFTISYDTYMVAGEGGQMVFDQPMESFILERGEVASIESRGPSG